MKKVPRFLLIFIILFVFAFVTILIYNLKVVKIEKVWLIFVCLKEMLLYLPLIATLSILWSLVFKSKNEVGRNPKDKFFLSFIFYVIFSFAFAFAMNEYVISKLEEKTYYQVKSKKSLLKLKTMQDITKEKFTTKEFKNLKYYPYKKNVAFAMGRAIVNMRRLYNMDNIYYITGLKVIGYTKKNQIDYIVTAKLAKIVGSQIYAYKPIFNQYKNGKLSKVKYIKGKRGIPLTYNIKAIYGLTPNRRLKELSLLNIFLYNEYIYGSKINFQRLGNVVYNKVSYYIILIFMMIVSASVGWSMRNQRLTGTKDIFTMVSFYVVSFGLTVLVYDMLIRMMNTIYGLIVI